MCGGSVTDNNYNNHNNNNNNNNINNNGAGDDVGTRKVTQSIGLQPSTIAAAKTTVVIVVIIVALAFASTSSPSPSSSLSSSSFRYRWWWCISATGSTALIITDGCKLTGCGCCYLPAICCLAAVITSLSLMRSRAAAFTDVNATADLVQHTAAVGRDVVVIRNEVVEAASAKATVVIATADNATADTLFRRPISPHRKPPNQTDPTAAATADPSAENDRVHHRPQSLGTVMVLMVVTVVVLGTVGLLTCVLHHYNHQYNQAVPCLQQSPGPPHRRFSTQTLPPLSCKKKKPTTIVTTATRNIITVSGSSSSSSNSSSGSSSRITSSRTAMLTMRSNNGLTQEHDRQVRLHSVRTDLELDLPPRIHLPDGEEYPYGSMAKLHLRNSEQEREIYQKCIRGPPNRTISQPHRSSSASGLTSSSEVDSITRCNSVSSRCLPRTGFPPVDNIQSLSSLTMVPCLSHVDKQTLSQ